MKLIHELWKDESEGEFTFCLAGPAGEKARSLLEGKTEKIWECEAETFYEAMTKYYEFQDWGEYEQIFVSDTWPYIDELGNTAEPGHGPDGVRQ